MESVYWKNSSINAFQTRVWTMLSLLLFLSPIQSSFAQSCLCPTGYTPNPDNTQCVQELFANPTLTLNSTAVDTGDTNSAFLSGANYYYETDGNLNWPFKTLSGNNPVQDSTGTTLANQTFPVSFWQGLVNSATPISIKGNAANTWFSKTFCMSIPTAEHQVFFVGGDDVWKLKIDGQTFAECTASYCFNNGLFLGKTLTAGDHLIEIRYNNTGGMSSPGALWFAEYANSAQQILNATSLATLTPRFSSDSLVGQTWDYNNNTGEVCPPGYTFDSCSSNRCKKIVTTGCLPPTITLSALPNISCETNNVITALSTLPSAATGIYTLQLMPSGQSYTSPPFAFSANANTPLSLTQIFANQFLNLIPGSQYRLSLTLTGIYSQTVVAPVLFTISSAGCGQLTVSPVTPTCGQKVELGIIDLPSPTAQVAWGIQAPGASIVWQTAWQTINGPSLTPKVDFYTLAQSLNVPTNIPGTYTVFLDLISDARILTRQFQIVTLSNSPCGQLTLTPENPLCGQTVTISIDGIPLNSEYMFGLQTGSGAIVWNGQWQIPLSSPFSVPSTVAFQGTTFAAGIVYTVYFQTKSNMGIVSTPQSLPFTMPTSCGNFSITTDSCGPGIWATVNGLPSGTSTIFKFGMGTGSNIQWTGSQTVSSTKIGPLNIYPELTGIQAGETYTLTYQSTTASLNNQTSETATLHYPTNTCADLKTDKKEYVCGEPIQITFQNTFQDEIDGVWKLTYADGSEIVPAVLPAGPFTYPANAIWSGPLTDLFQGSPPLQGTYEYKLTFVSTHTATNRTSIFEKIFTVTENLISISASTPNLLGEINGAYVCDEGSTFTFNLVPDSTNPLRNPQEIIWNFNQGTPSQANTLPATSTWNERNDLPGSEVTLQIKYENGCISKAATLIKVNANNKPFIPNAFTPNGDGNNDTFDGYGTDIVFDSFIIFNRWGEKVFEAYDTFHPSWDGKYKGEDAPLAQYTIVAEYRRYGVSFNKSEPLTKNTYRGSLTLIR